MDISPTSRQHSQRSDKNSRQAEILEIATELFREKGYHATSLDDIANRVGFTKPAIYYYFDSKEDILFSIVDAIVEGGLQRISEIASRPTSPTSRLRDLLVENTRVLLENLDANSVFYNERGLLSPEREKAIRTRERQYTRIVRDLYVEGVRAGEFADVDPSIATSTLLGASIWAYRWFNPEGRFSADKVANEIASLVLHGCQRSR